MRRLSSQLLKLKQNSLQDPETNLPNRNHLELHIESIIEHCNTRGGGLGLALIRINSANNKLRLGSIRSIAHSIQLSLRPMDLVSRYDGNTFAVSLQYQDPATFNLELFDRLVDSIRRNAPRDGDSDQALQISIGTWHGHDFDLAPSFAEIIAAAQQGYTQIT
jgi:diguanylate cyclase (GGDEF)-like protein